MPDYTDSPRRITLYRDDSSTPVIYDHVKHIWWEARGTVLVIAYYIDDRGAHDYAHWPRERIAWFREEKIREPPTLT